MRLDGIVSFYSQLHLPLPPHPTWTPACRLSGEGARPLQLLIIHEDPAVLGPLSDRLCDAGLPHFAVLGTPVRPLDLLKAVYRAGAEALGDFVFVQSLVGSSTRPCPPSPSIVVWARGRPISSAHFFSSLFSLACLQAAACSSLGTTDLGCWTRLVGDHGIVSLDSFRQEQGETGGSEEGGDVPVDEERERESCHAPMRRRAAFGDATALLTAANAAGLVPRPASSKLWIR
jgi:hypothetical protein